MPVLCTRKPGQGNWLREHKMFYALDVVDILATKQLGLAIKGLTQYAACFCEGHVAQVHY